MLVTEKLVEEMLARLKVLLAIWQVPAALLVHDFAPPGLNVPLTVALGTGFPVVSRTSTVAYASQFLRPEFAAPDEIEPIEALITTGSCGDPSANENTNRFGDPLPTLLSLFTDAWSAMNCATASGELWGDAARTKAATPAT